MSRSSDHDHSRGLVDLPAWGLEIMMGLYGPATITAALEAERKPVSGAMDRSAAALSAVGFVPVYLPASAMPPVELPSRPEQPPKMEKAMPVGELSGAAVGPAMAEFVCIDALGRRLAQLFRRR